MPRYAILRDPQGTIVAATLARTHSRWDETSRALHAFLHRYDDEETDPFRYADYTLGGTDEPPTLDVAIDEETEQAILDDTADDSVEERVNRRLRATADALLRHLQR